MGHLVGKTYVNTKESWATAVKYLKLDLARSLQTRFELLCETLEMLEQDEKAADPKTPYFNPLVIPASYLLPHTWLLPRRVFTKNNHVLYCDYLSASDTVQDCVDRFDAMLAIKTESAQLEQAESFRDDVALDSEVMWSKRPTKGPKKDEARAVSKPSSDNIDEKLRNIKIDPAEIDTSLTTSRLIQKPEPSKTKWSMAILVLIVASILARTFFA